MDFHLVGGFLGSGKTTAIIATSKILMSQGLRVGVVTNDQGKYLVDTAFFELASVPTVEVTGGCFCCNYDDLDARLSQLKHTAQPDVIFAESVGSCADIVATVVKPLLALRDDGFTPTSFSVFVDARMLRRRLLKMHMPFSNEVVYIFDKQIEEAGILVINKRDLLTDGDAANLLALAKKAYPEKVITLQNSLDAESVKDWLSIITRESGIVPVTSLEIDYQLYGSGEKKLAWLDETVTIRTNEGMGRQAVLTFLTHLMSGVSHQELPVGHVKVLIKGQNADVKLSFVSMTQPEWVSEIPVFSGTNLTILLNARVEGEPDRLRDVVRNAVTATENKGLAHLQETEISTFHPDFPVPTHRITD